VLYILFLCLIVIVALILASKSAIFGSGPPLLDIPKDLRFGIIKNLSATEIEQLCASQKSDMKEWCENPRNRKKIYGFLLERDFGIKYQYTEGGPTNEKEMYRDQVSKSTFDAFLAIYGLSSYKNTLISANVNSVDELYKLTSEDLIKAGIPPEVSKNMLDHATEYKIKPLRSFLVPKHLDALMKYLIDNGITDVGDAYDLATRSHTDEGKSIINKMNEQFGSRTFDSIRQMADAHVQSKHSIRSKISKRVAAVKKRLGLESTLGPGQRRRLMTLPDNASNFDLFLAIHNLNKDVLVAKGFNTISDIYDSALPKDLINAGMSPEAAGNLTKDSSLNVFLDKHNMTKYKDKLKGIDLDNVNDISEYAEIIDLLNLGIEKKDAENLIKYAKEACKKQAE